MFCKYCGNQLDDDAVFCAKCGKKQDSNATQVKTDSITTSIANGITDISGAVKKVVENEVNKINNKNIDSSYTETRQEYAGVVKKCPNCGEPISNGLVVRCPTCNYELNRREAAKGITELSNALKNALFNKKEIIENYIVPNNKEEIIEFIFLGIGDINRELEEVRLDNQYNKHYSVVLSWKHKIISTIDKAKTLFADDEDFIALLNKKEDELKQIQVENISDSNIPKDTNSTSNKKKSTAAILCFFLSNAAAYIYVEKVGKGIFLYFLSTISWICLQALNEDAPLLLVAVFAIAVLWIWSVVDFIRILAGKFRDKDNRLIVN